MADLHETHYVPAFTNPGRHKLAVCGATVRMIQHDAEPSCAECRAWLNADASETAKYPTVEAHAAALFGADEPAEPVRLNTFDALANYRPKGGAR